MKNISALATLLGACVFAAACSPQVPDDPVPSSRATAAPKAPEFTGITDWLNGPPQTLAALRGKVVLVEFWAYTCGNCQRVVPHLKDWHARYRDKGLVMVGVHTPEYIHEKPLQNVRTAVEQLGITWPVGLDNEYATWNAYENRFWPALYLIDQDGRIVYQHIGEGDYEETEARIRALLSR